MWHHPLPLFLSNHFAEMYLIFKKNDCSICFFSEMWYSKMFLLVFHKVSERVWEELLICFPSHMEIISKEKGIPLMKLPTALETFVLPWELLVHRMLCVLREVMRSQGWFLAPAWISHFANGCAGVGSYRQVRDSFCDLVVKM